MELQIRNSQDPFTQTLAFLFATAKDAGLKERFRAVMTPLVTQVAVKIGAINTEQSIRDRALPVFTGIISLQLAHLVHGKDGSVMDVWVEQVDPQRLTELFRRGYTLLDQLMKNTEEGKKGGSLMSVQTFAERLQEFATHSEHGVWAGYQLYLRRKGAYIDKLQVHKFARWLDQRTVLQSRATAKEFFEDTARAEETIKRVVFNVFHSNRVSVEFNFRKVDEIVKKARASKKWLTRAQSNFAAFVEGLPVEFRECLSGKNQIADVFRSCLEFAEELSDKRTLRTKNVDYLCIAVGIAPPGLSKEFEAEEAKQNEE